MKTFSAHLLSDLEQQINQYGADGTDPIKKAFLSMHAAEDAVNQLKAFIIEYQFADEAEEINFFKHVKPQFVSKLIYYNRVYHFELCRPQGSRKAVKKYLKKELGNVQHFFESQKDFFKYYRSGSSLADHCYFLRKPVQGLSVKDIVYYETDHRFATVHDYTMAQMIANGMVLKFLEGELQQLNKKVIPAPQDSTGMMKWTESKASLVELIYGLHCQAAINEGKPNIKELAAIFQRIFQIDLGDFYRCFLAIRMRKTGRTKFIDGMRDMLNKRMDDHEDDW